MSAWLNLLTPEGSSIAVWLAIAYLTTNGRLQIITNKMSPAPGSYFSKAIYGKRETRLPSQEAKSKVIIVLAVLLPREAGDRGTGRV